MQTAAADPVTIQYNSNTIGTLADSGRVTLKCADKRMLSDVEINYGVENYAPSAITSTGDVTVTYGEGTIGTLSDSGTLTLATGGTRVLHDIDVNYTKPSGIEGVKVVVNNTANADISVTEGKSLLVDNEHLIITSAETPVIDYIAPMKSGSSYQIRIHIPARSDDLNVTINSTPLSFYEDGYNWEYSDAAYPDQITISISNK